jgi:hypothetical protein
LRQLSSNVYESDLKRSEQGIVLLLGEDDVEGGSDLAHTKEMAGHDGPDEGVLLGVFATLKLSVGRIN